MPFFSILYPTRNRPNYLSVCLEAVSQFTFDDYEIIISDNSAEETAYPLYQNHIHNSRIKYFWTGGNLSMCENYEFALSKCTGDFISAQTDKSFLKPSALEILFEVINSKNYDLISWGDSGYKMINEEENINNGYTYDVPVRHELISYDPSIFLNEMINFIVHRKYQSKTIRRAKIFFGMASRELVNKCKIQGAFFHNYAPDYTTRVTLLLNAKNAIELTLPLQTTFNSLLSNGDLCAFYPHHAYYFFNTGDQLKRVFQYFPVSGLYVSQQNHLCGDLIQMFKLLNLPVHINYHNLHKTIIEDMAYIRWSSLNEFMFHFKILVKYLWKYNKLLSFYYYFILLKLYLKRLFKFVKHNLFIVFSNYFPSVAESIRLKLEANSSPKLYFKKCIDANIYFDKKIIVAYKNPIPIQI